MSTNRFIYFILAAFIAGNFILIFIKFNSEKNTSNLIDDNKKLLNEFAVSKQLKALESDVLQVDNKIRGMIAVNDSSYIRDLLPLKAGLRSDLDKLQEIKDDPASENYIDQLDSLVQEKLKIDDELIDIFRNEGKKAAEEGFTGRNGKILSDSISVLIQKTASLRQKVLSDITDSIDKNVRKMQRLDSILIIFVLICAAGLFWYIINTVRTQTRLIAQVSRSEKQVKEAARLKENFLANMSHEIRTPMNAILGFSNLLGAKDLDTDSRYYVQTIQQSAESLLTVINDILDLSKMEAGMLRMESRPFSLRGLVDSIDALFRTKANEKRLQFLIEVDPGIPDMLEGDPTRLKQVIMNLVGNALKFTERGKVDLSFVNTGIQKDKIDLVIEVKDTGIGIHPDQLEHVFDRFRQADNAITRQYGGTGLGLAIVRELVQLQNGTIEVESKPGEGSSFRVGISFGIYQGRVSSEKQIPKEEKDAFKNSRILIVEDNEVNQSLLQHLFRNWQIGYKIAGNGEEAIAKLKEERYDLVLMDIQMPGMDGYAATQYIRTGLKMQLPIIAMTAHALAGEREKCLSYGMDEYLSKPIREQELKNLLRQFLSVAEPIHSATAAIDGSVLHSYKCIDLSYLKEISEGNQEYEKDVTEKFIRAIPQSLKKMEEAIDSDDAEQLKKLAHDMKTTVSVMGLNEKLEPYLDQLEYGSSDETKWRESFAMIRSTCELALPEAENYLTSIRN